MRTGQSPTARTPSPVAPTADERPLMPTLSKIHGDAPAHGSASTPMENLLAAFAARLLPRTCTPVASLTIRTAYDSSFAWKAQMPLSSTTAFFEPSSSTPTDTRPEFAICRPRMKRVELKQPFEVQRPAASKVLHWF